MDFAQLVSKFRYRILMALAFLVLAGLWLYSFRQTSITPAVIAVGLRGDSRVTKALSPLQQQRLNKNFLEMPAVPSTHGQNGDVISDVNRINDFNRRQTQ